MRFVVNRVSGNQETKRPDMQRGGVVGVGVTSVDHADLTSLQIEALSLQLRGDRQMFWNLSRPAAGPMICDHFRGRRRAHRPHHVGSSDGARLRKPLQQKGQTEEVVWMAV